MKKLWDTHFQNLKKTRKLETTCTHNEPSQNSNSGSNISTKKETFWEDHWNNESIKLCNIHSRSQLVKYWKEDKDYEINGLDILKNQKNTENSEELWIYTW